MTDKLLDWIFFFFALFIAALLWRAGAETMRYTIYLEMKDCMSENYPEVTNECVKKYIISRKNKVLL